MCRHLKYYFAVCVYVCVCQFLHMCGGQRLTSSVLHCSPPVFWHRVSHWSWSLLLTSASECLESVLLTAIDSCPLCWGCRHWLPLLAFQEHWGSEFESSCLYRTLYQINLPPPNVYVSMFVLINMYILETGSYSLECSQTHNPVFFNFRTADISLYLTIAFMFW